MAQLKVDNGNGVCVCDSIAPSAERHADIVLCQTIRHLHKFGVEAETTTKQDRQSFVIKLLFLI